MFRAIIDLFFCIIFVRRATRRRETGIGRREMLLRQPTRRSRISSREQRQRRRVRTAHSRGGISPPANNGGKTAKKQLS